MTTPFIDTQCFADENFNVKAWINQTLNKCESTAEKDTTVLVTQLQLVSDQTSQKVGAITDNVIKTMPRMLYDLKLIAEDARRIKDDIDQVRQNVGGMEGDTAEALEKLRQLHLVKTRMESCRSSLREAENWSNLEEETNAILAKEDWEAAAVRLQSAQQSLDVFQHTPEYEPRSQLLNRLQENLETAIRSKVIQALEDHDATECQKFYKVFSKIGRAEEFVDLYFEVRTPAVHPLWSAVSAAEASSPLHEALDGFYKSMYSLVSEEYTWCSYIFADARIMAQTLVQNMMQSLNPPLDDKLNTIQQQQEAEALPLLVSTFHVTESFGLSLERLFSKLPVNTASTDDRSTLDAHLKTHARRRSHSNSISLIPLTLRHTDVNAWSYSLYEPFLPLQTQYATLELGHLTKQLTALFKNVKINHLSNAMETIQTVSNTTIDQVFRLLKKSLDRCLTLTHGYGSVEWLKVANEYVCETNSQLSRFVAEINKKMTTSEKRPETEDDTAPPRRSTSSDVTEDLDFDADLIQSDWSIFQIGLRSLGICQEMEVQLKALVETVCRGLRDIMMAEHHDKYPHASLGLLRTSILNTHELQSLMNQVSSVTEEGQENAVAKALSNAQWSIWRFAEQCQLLVHEAIHTPMTRHLADIRTIQDAWTAETEDKYQGRNRDATLDVDMPTFNLSPNEYITRIGEQLLMLPQQFEVYSDDKAFAYRLETVPFMNEEDREEKELGSEKSEDDKEEQDDDTMSNEQIIQRWTTSVARGVMKSFLTSVFEIKNLSAQGSRQLRTDIEYLVNVLSALDVEPLSDLVEMYEYLNMDEPTIIRELSRMAKDSDADNHILKNVAKMRGVVLLDLPK
ncbi:oligomeric Golgi complex subunit 7 [Radiomyces spectabilis]|uniref:oligomeric Golgi complex subunit 7 n=1 Tax=Radiomyces spectabilis TaxID=64574 RepID=UPI00221FC55F|nr:oligomeric Golgi complex subunit 7 [Radiomyces spectabilis]KAI8390969.1 oligomeric Golgi complex subunit 7 [Radiomyces spectabilis]